MFNFELEDDDGQQEQQTQVQQQPRPVRAEVAAAVEEFVDDQREQQPEAFDAQMSEAERRLEKAQYYRLLLNQKLFSDSSEAAADIESELREFIRQRLGVLLGIVPERKAAAVENQFSSEEATVLREIAAKLLKSPTAMAKVKEPPRLNTVSTPKKPEVRQVSTTPASAAPKQQQQPVKKRPGPKPQPTGDTLEVDGVMYYKVVDGKNGEHYVDDAGQKYRVGVVPSGANEGKQFMQNITGQAKPKGVKGFPTPASPEQFQAAQQSMSTQSLGASGKVLATSSLGNIINEVLK